MDDAPGAFVVADDVCQDRLQFVRVDSAVGTKRRAACALLRMAASGWFNSCASAAASSPRVATRMAWASSPRSCSSRSSARWRPTTLPMIWATSLSSAISSSRHWRSRRSVAKATRAEDLTVRDQGDGDFRFRRVAPERFEIVRGLRRKLVPGGEADDLARDDPGMHPRQKPLCRELARQRRPAGPLPRMREDHARLRLDDLPERAAIEVECFDNEALSFLDGRIDVA